MASVVSSSASPLSALSGVHTDSSTGTDEESWAFVDLSGGSGTSSIGFFASPSSGSLASFPIVGTNGGQIQPSPPAPSPLYLSDNSSMSMSAVTSGDSIPAAPSGNTAFSVTSAPATNDQDQFLAEGQPLLAPGDFVLDDLPDLSSFFSSVPPPQPDVVEQGEQPLSTELEIPASMQTGPGVAPWDPTSLKPNNLFVAEEVTIPPSSSPSQSLSPARPERRASPAEKLGSSGSKLATPALNKVKSSRVRKKPEKKRSLAAVNGCPPSPGQWVNITPESIHGKQNVFECFSAEQKQGKGRKGPLEESTKIGALQVRRIGACAACRARKVKCDCERPCRNCKKLMLQVPEAVCWQFSDFVPVLFPVFLRAHFSKEEMKKFTVENVDSFAVDGAENPCIVEMYSGPTFSSTLAIKARFYTAKTAEILQHWHYTTGPLGVNLRQLPSVALGLGMDGSAQKDELRKSLKDYIHQVIREPCYAAQLTDHLELTLLPRLILQIVQNYALRSGSEVVRHALTIYATHYVMTRHLTLTAKTIVGLRSSGFIPQSPEPLTARLLNRQIKAVLDDLLIRELQQLFEKFAKVLKPKSRKEWAPCMAAFLVLCLFMEDIETAADVFAVFENEVDLRNWRKATFKRGFALDINREIENLPFKQFAFQFHQIYLTHTRDASAKSFNPFLDDGQLTSGDLDDAAVEMVLRLRHILQNDWSELDFLVMDAILPHNEPHPFPRDISVDYTGRLMSKFLLSFTDEWYIFNSKP